MFTVVWPAHTSDAHIHAVSMQHTRHYAAPRGAPAGGATPSNQQPPPRARSAPSPQRAEWAALSAGFIYDPYQPPTPLGWDWALTPEGRARARARANNIFLQLVGRALARASIPYYSDVDLKATALDLYRRVNTAIAQGQLQGLEDLVLPAELRAMERDMARWRQQGWLPPQGRVVWGIQGDVPLRDIRIVHARSVKVDKSHISSFHQLTLRIPSKQHFAVYSGSNRAGQGGSGGGDKKLVAGSVEAVIDVVDYWVLERKALDPMGSMGWLEAARTLMGRAKEGGPDVPGARWRLAKRLVLQQPTQQQQQPAKHQPQQGQQTSQGQPQQQL